MARHESTQSEESLVGLRFIYRPGAAQSSPLVLLIHGRAGDRSVMWTFERGIPEGCHVVSLEAFLPDPLGGWSWWDMTAEGAQRDAILHAARRVKAALAAFIALYSLKPSKVVAVGFSQGSVLCTALVFSGLAELDGVGVLAGFVFLPDDPAVVIKKPSVFIAHGTADETVSVHKARKGADALQTLGINVRYVEEEVGHKVGIQGTRALKDWLRELLAKCSPA